MSNTAHGQECRELSEKCQGISHCLESGHTCLLYNATVLISDVYMARVQADAADQQLTGEDLPPRVAVVEVRCFIIIEKQIVVWDVQFPDAMQLMFCLFFDLNLEYSQQKKQPIYYFEFTQKFWWNSKAQSPTNLHHVSESNCFVV